jgi:hypothetical protein
MPGTPGLGIFHVPDKTDIAAMSATEVALASHYVQLNER